MKKILFSTMVIAAMASCSQNEIIAEGPIPDSGQQIGLISFASQFGNTVATRAGKLDTLKLDSTVSLGVFAFNGSSPVTIYDKIEDMRLRFIAGKKGWFLNPADHYYPANGSSVDFWAYGPKGNTHLSSIDCDTLTGPKFTLRMDSTDIGPTAVDIFATQEVRRGDFNSAKTPITFTLKHLLSQVKFTGRTKEAKDTLNYDVKIFDIKVISSGQAKYKNKMWRDSTKIVTWKPVDEDDTQAALREKSTSVGELVSLIPGQPTSIIVNARIYKKKGALLLEQKDTLNLDNTTIDKKYLEPGKCYTYAIIVSPKVGKIEFGTPGIVDWVPVADTVNIPKPVAPAPVP